MIISFISKVEWAKRPPSLPTLHPSGSLTLDIDPRPDRETLRVGGLIAALALTGVDVTVLAVSNRVHEILKETSGIVIDYSDGNRGFCLDRWKRT